VKAFALTFEGFVPFYLEHSRLHLLSVSVDVLPVGFAFFTLPVCR
jgi:hypothetical protein